MDADRTASTTKSTVDEIRQRFDNDVERFSNLDAGQTATVDAPLAMELIAQAALAATPSARRLLDVGCGAGNYSLKLLQKSPTLEVTLVDLSLPMLQRARERIAATLASEIRCVQADIRDLELGEAKFDLVVAAAVLHHLRTDEEWKSVFAKFHRALAQGGSLWVFDLVDGESPAVRELMRRRYASYLESLHGPDYRRDVLAYIEKEDTPRSLPYQLDLLRAVGFRVVDVLHKNACFAAFGAVKR